MATILPYTNEYGCYEIRLESIGGLGANLCGKILGELGALGMGLSCSSFSSYGSEKMGSPVKAFVRYAAPGTPILLNSPVERPHILGLFHERMAGKLPVMAGVTEDTNVVINTAQSCDIIRDALGMYAGTLWCIDAQAIAAECGTRLNMVMLGAIAKASGFMPLEVMERIVTDTVGVKYPSALPGNLKGLRRGFEAAGSVRYEPDGRYPRQEYKELEQAWGYANAPIGGVIPIPGSTISNDLSAARGGQIPVFKKETCINCGLCDTVCPDMCFQFVPGEYKGKSAMVNSGLDYIHCKGCLRCTRVCPTDALTVGNEREHDIWKTHVPNLDLIASNIPYEDTGTNSYMESESGTVNELY